MFLDDIVKQYDAYKENGAISGDVDFDKAVDTSITEKAVEILGAYERVKRPVAWTFFSKNKIREKLAFMSLFLL